MLYSAGYSGHSRQQIVPTSLRLPVNSGHSQSGDTGSSNDFIHGILGSVPRPLAPHIFTILAPSIWDKAETVWRQLDMANK